MLNSVFVILGAALWATDTLFRHPMAQSLSAPTIVFVEHFFALIAAAAWLLFVEREKLKFSWVAILGGAGIGIFGSATATVFFTMSFQFVNPTVSILLQKIQPIIVILLSWIFLKERLSWKFFAWAAVAMTAAFFLSFPHGISINRLQIAELRGAVLALTAALLWAISTVVGKIVLGRIPGPQLTFWRFLFGFIILGVAVTLIPQCKLELPFVRADSNVLRSIFFMALIPGFFGVNLYYRGLGRIRASVATLLELAFPLCAVFVNSRFLSLHLENIQLAAAGVLLFAILRIGRI